MYNSNNSNFSIVQKKFIYYPGDTFEGKLFMSPDNEVLIEDVEFSLNMMENWFCPYESKKNAYNNKTLLNFNLNLKQFFPDNKGQFVKLSKIKYNFPFKFTIPNNLNPSFEYPTDKYRVFIRYILMAKIQSNDYPGNTSIYILIQGNPINNNPLNEVLSIPMKKWGLFDKGNSKLKVSSPTNNFKFNDIIPININVDNSNSKKKLNKFKIYLIRNLVLKDEISYSDKYINNEKVLRREFKSEVKKNEIKDFEFKLPLKELFSKYYTYSDYKQPYTNDNRSSIDLIPSIYSTIIKCEYFIKVIAYYDEISSKNERPRIILPVYMVHRLKDNHIIEAKNEEDLKKAIEESKRIELEKNNIINKQEEEDIRRAIEESKKDEEERNRKNFDNNYNKDNDKIIINNLNDNIDENEDDEMILPTKSFLDIEKNKDISNSLNNNSNLNNNNSNLINNNLNSNNEKLNNDINKNNSENQNFENINKKIEYEQKDNNQNISNELNTNIINSNNNKNTSNKPLYDINSIDDFEDENNNNNINNKNNNKDNVNDNNKNYYENINEID